MSALPAAAPVPVGDSPVRSLVLWCPDWPVVALSRAGDTRVHPDEPVALVEANRVVACSAAARREGVRRGQRRREAQSRCPTLRIVRHDPGLDQRAFAPVIDALEEVTPGVQILRPGLSALRVRGPARYYGGEIPAALTLVGILTELGIPEVRAGVADGPFTAEHAARRADPVRVVPPGKAAEFLAPLPIAVLDDADLIGLLQRLGVRTLGDFATLAPDEVRGRLGDHGALLHALAGGLDSRRIVPRVPPRDLDREVSFEPPLDNVDQVAFGIRVAAERFVDGLAAAHLVCTSLGVEIAAENGERSERVWLHPRAFAAGEVVDRVRWQLQGATPGQGGLRSGVVRVRLTPETVDAIGNHEHGLWGAGPDDRVHAALSRVQSMLGHRGVVTATVGGGRTLADRQTLVPWGDRPVHARERGRPWPGSLPPPVPSTVFPTPRAVTVTDAQGAAVTVDERGHPSAPPAAFTLSNGAGASTPHGAARRTVASWAGPWTVQERWWDAASTGPEHRFQVVDGDGIAWLLLLRGDGWWAEARYD
ncbi:protein ImuB [Diaminobutyricimonas aerilata]|uniref:Protein ImuB n=1 Tax=Diaminobutyricimonas aerilata TaxID=1162967 RepID=A0A2M9CJV3_9MICO|nr:DNA polymerase Y family protein [Diaminobutyricimonas aerilata]PJJ72177.1 protein ImuB [Diaminobutyricimonas aerilata]